MANAGATKAEAGLMSFSRLHLVNFETNGKTVVVSTGTDLLEAARRARIGLASVCGGQRECGECLIAVIDGQVSRVTAEEKEALSDSELENGLRLACCTRVFSAVRVQIPKST